MLAAPAAPLFAGRPLQGVAAGGGAWLEFLLNPAHTRFLPRPNAERDTAWKQIIPYVLLRSGNAQSTRIFSYRRGAAGGEARLHRWRSIGLGGHINPGDEGLFSAAGWDAYQAAAARELHEEVAIAAPVLRRRIAGVLNDDSLEVGRVHVGIIEIWDLQAPLVRPRERKIAEPAFCSLAALRQHADQLESWSRLCLQAWPALDSLPGWTPPAAWPGVESGVQF